MAKFNSPMASKYFYGSVRNQSLKPYFAFEAHCMIISIVKYTDLLIDDYDGQDVVKQH